LFGEWVVMIGSVLAATRVL